ncbi:MAG: GTPase Era [Eubacteriales bacterium]
MTKKTGFISIVGRPNVGKSTLLNALTGEKIAIVSKKPQTTRNRITGILTKGDTQYVFLDTPGIHKARNLLGKYMVKSAGSAMSDVDVILFVVEPSDRIGQTETEIIEKLKKTDIPVILIINKIDAVQRDKVAAAIAMYSAHCDFYSVIPISALKNDGVDIIFGELDKNLKESGWFFPEDSITDQPERQIASEIIREKLLRLLDDEIPHGIAVVIEEFKEREDGMVDIRAEIFCERETHKGIIIGKNGEMLKKIGTYAREDLEKLLDTKVFLNLWVKVKEKWRDSEFLLRNFGYNKNDE